jgi:methionyl-tRNA formyltransferase
LIKIGYFADGPWSHEALKKIMNSPVLKVAFIVARYDTGDPILRNFAEQLKIPFLRDPNVNSPDFIKKIQSLDSDIFVSMSFNQILKPKIIASAPLGFINCHAGALPFYRGRNVLNWSLINGEKQFGVTVHYIDEGIDTGDIILQRFSPILDSDDYSSLLKKAYYLCADTLFDSLILIEKGESKRIEQESIHPVGFYCSRRSYGDEYIDWSWTSERIHNFIRAINIPGPCARTVHGNKQIAILQSELIDKAPDYLGIPGVVVGRDDLGILVKTGDSTLRIIKVASISKEGILEERMTPIYNIGTRFGINPWVVIKNLEERIEKLEKQIVQSK